MQSQTQCLPTHLSNSVLSLPDFLSPSVKPLSISYQLSPWWATKKSLMSLFLFLLFLPYLIWFHVISQLFPCHYCSRTTGVPSSPLVFYLCRVIGYFWCLVTKCVWRFEMEILDIPWLPAKNGRLDSVAQEAPTMHFYLFFIHHFVLRRISLDQKGINQFPYPSPLDFKSQYIIKNTSFQSGQCVSYAGEKWTCVWDG